LESKLFELNPLMLKSGLVKLLQLKAKIWNSPLASCRIGAATLFAAMLLAFLPHAAAQDFTLQLSQFNPSSVEPGPDGTALSTISIGTVNSVSGVDVDLTCAVTSNQTGVVLPTCLISPNSVTSPGQASLTLSAASGTTPGNYTVTVTGAGSGGPHQAALPLSVLSVTPQYTLTISTTISPTSVPAGNGATAILTLNPVDGYSGTINLVCSQVTPPVVLSPVCSFNPNPVTLNGGVPETTTLLISTTGTTTNSTAANSHSRAFYAFLFPLPGLALIAGIVTKKRRGKILALICLLAIVALILLTPACNNNSIITNTGVTPNNTYTFTVTAFDGTGQAPGNSTAITVALTVN
jgi:hypothetical protein